MSRQHFFWKNLEKSGNSKMVSENAKSQGKIGIFFRLESLYRRVKFVVTQSL